MNKYYEINETAARQAMSMWSFREYVDGSKTAEYRKQVDECYKLVEELPDDLKEKGEAIADRYSRRLADWYNKQFKIEMMCPSVMISGAGNFPVRKKEKQNNAEDRHYELYKEIQEIPGKIESLMRGTNIIKSGDENAVKQLEAKLEKLMKNQDYMKKANAYYRKNKTLKGFSGFSDEKAEQLDKSIEADPLYKVPFAPCQLQNNNANIRRIKGRIESIKKTKQQAVGKDDVVISDENSTELFKVHENADIMRLQIAFDGKPDADVRSILKKHGFRWSPSNGVWQRQLTNNARYAVKLVIKEIRERK